MFFSRCSYKNSWFSELACNSSVCANLMICCLNFKKYVFLRNIAWNFVLFLLVSKLYPVQVVISLSLWTKLTMDQLLLLLLLLFCETSAAFLVYVGGVLGTNLFSQFVIETENMSVLSLQITNSTISSIWFLRFSKLFLYLQ